MPMSETNQAAEGPLARWLGTENGRAADLARHCRVSPQAVDKWKRRVPAERVKDVVEFSGGALSPHALRPDIYPDGFAFPAGVAA